MIVVLNTDNGGKYYSKWRDVKESTYGLLSSVWREMVNAGDITEVSPPQWHSERCVQFGEQYMSVTPYLSLHAIL